MVWFMNYEESQDRSGSGKIRLWEEAVKYGFISAGGGEKYTRSLPKMQKGDEIWACVPNHGYVGYGIVQEEAVPAAAAVVYVNGEAVPFFSLPLVGSYFRDAFEEDREFILLVKWVKAVPIENSVWEKGFFSYRGINCNPRERWPETSARLREIWGLKK